MGSGREIGRAVPVTTRRSRAARLAAAVAALAFGAATGCGGGGSSGGANITLDSSTGQLVPSALTVIDSSPSDGALQVAPDAVIEVTFDGVLVSLSLQASGTSLRVASGPSAGDTVPGLLATTPDGTGVTFTPSQPLAAATDYVFRLAPAIASTDGRLLESAWSTSFTTLDTTPPSVASSSLADGSVDVDRQVSLTIGFDETIELTTGSAVALRDAGNVLHPVATSVVGENLLVDPIADLTGGETYTLTISGGLTDRVGNPVEPWTLTFTTEIDTVAPRYVAGWPAGRTGVSPQAVPWLRFDESVDPSSFGTDDLALSDLLGNRPRFRIEASPDRRTIYLVPEQALTPGRLYLLSLNGGTDGPTDSNGNRIQSTTTFSFSVGTDAAPPTISDSFPADGAAGIGTELTAQVRFSEAIDADTVDVERVRLVRVSDGAGVPATVTTTGGTTIELVPDDELERDAEYRVEILGGRDGVCDMAGNPLPTTANATFRTSSTGVGMTVLVQPFNGAVGVPRGARVSATFSEPVDPATVRPTTFRVYRTNDLAPVAGTLQVLRGGRVVRFLPTFAWGATTSYTVEVLGGVDGVRSADGERPLQRTSLFRFTTGTGVDSRAPDVAVTLNGIGDLRKSNLTVPSYGFTIDVNATDSIDFSLDSSSFRIQLTDPSGVTTEAEDLFVGATVDGRSISARVPLAGEFEFGNWTVVGIVEDLTGNVGSSAPFSFRVASLTADAAPFDRTQTVWVRFDLDRNGNGTGDFVEDLMRLGLIAEGDPAGANDRMIELVRAGILAHAHTLFGRDPSGLRPAGGDAVPLWLTDSPPIGSVNMMIACGGLDPEGSQNRVYGDDSTGTLGRAFFDYRNARPTEHNIATQPGLGVFPSELFLFEAQVDQVLYPSFLTSFGNRFRPLCPNTNGTPAGAGAEDAVVLAEDFVRAQATTVQRARYDAIMRAADDWAVAIGTILAHEIGHAIGLVAAGPNPVGLHGDQSLHNAFAQSTDVMAAAVGFDSLVSLDFRFRDLTRAYLRHRILMK
jgi:hypothetical protein